MVEFAKSIDAKCVLRGIRAISDYEYELQMALMNRKLEPTLETAFHAMPRQVFLYVSSRLVREVAQAGGPVKGLVPEVVEQKLREKLESRIQTSRPETHRSPEEKEEEGMTTATTEALRLTERINRIEPLRHHGGGGGGGQAAAAGNRRGRFWCGRAAFRDAAAHQRCRHCGTIEGNFTTVTPLWRGRTELRDTRSARRHHAWTSIRITGARK